MSLKCLQTDVNVAATNGAETQHPSNRSTEASLTTGNTPQTSTWLTELTELAELAVTV